MRLEWDSNPRMTVLQTAVLDHFTIEPYVMIFYPILSKKAIIKLEFQISLSFYFRIIRESFIFFLIVSKITSGGNHGGIVSGIS
jgi:hypothetical protein